MLVQWVKRERGEMTELQGYQDQKDPLAHKDHKVCCTMSISVVKVKKVIHRQMKSLRSILLAVFLVL